MRALHRILAHDVVDRNVFDSYYEAKEMLGRYFSDYNHHRLHRSIGFIRPPQKWEEAQVIYDTPAAAAAFSENMSS